jgi:hypothetical protein
MAPTGFSLLGEFEEELEELEPLFGRRGSRAHAAFESPASVPVDFDVFPPRLGCPAWTKAHYKDVVRAAVNEAIQLANNAASKLEAAVSAGPGKRDKEAKETARLFGSFFCHDPSRPVTWAGNQASGASVATRFRAVASALAGGLHIRYRCDPFCSPTERAYSYDHHDPNVIYLCPLFWFPPKMRGLPSIAFRGGVILHEMLHVLYRDFFYHRPGERRRNNAYCFKAFALRAKGWGQDNIALSGCTGRPC